MAKTAETTKAMVDKPKKKTRRSALYGANAVKKEQANILVDMNAQQLEAEIERVKSIPNDEFKKNKVELLESFLKKFKKAEKVEKTVKKGKKEVVETTDEQTEDSKDI